ncbi:hypothetical protein [Botrimarina mediterranea]|uniref:Protein kinase domain-containing protein n=1 Tax=Botrimarina mediterranea TaxID=2528022 RepID=A0A518K9S9_9BACT|nr:hypothetical protein [Botrimarina mediterranea]QDV74546.1 hypothetical protein Spa11_27500 [Botrimarina mediterranea]QDV79186.1 hypothetical protein K2D_27970 [Planctomycetes bacterium K2D]
MKVLHRNAQAPTTLGATVGVGGYGAAYEGPTGSHVYKLGEVDFGKVAHLIANRVVPTMQGYCYAWPEAVCLDPVSGYPCCYAMQKANDGVETEMLFSGLQVPEWFRVRVVLNHVRSLIDLEAAGYRRGDLPNSLFHRDASITEIDLDSLQVNHPGATYHSGAAKVTTAPPEVLEHYQQGGGPGFETTREHDAWAFASLAWLVLMRGEHPFDAVPVGAGAAANLTQRVLAGQWPHDPNCATAEPRPGSLPLSYLDPSLQSLFRQTFVDGHPNRDPRNRPTLQAWEKALQPLDILTP